MQEWHSTDLTYDQIIEKYGPWSAMSISLGNGKYTKEPAVDHRLKRIVQSIVDAIDKPLGECRVLDLACLEGHYGIEFALQGSEVVCVEIREANLVKTQYVKDALGLNNCKIYQDDVRNLNPDLYGVFDIIICSGILYHLRGEEAIGLIESMYSCSNGVCFLDTYIALRSENQLSYKNVSYSGIKYIEHDDTASSTEREADLWASIDNSSSFWFTNNSLVSIIANAGFTSTSQIMLPTHPDLTFDRRSYLVVKGVPCDIKSSEITNSQEHVDTGLENPTSMHHQQIKRSLLFTLVKNYFPQSAKSLIKPILQKLGILKTGDIKEFK